MILRKFSLKEYAPLVPYLTLALFVFIAAVSGLVPLTEEVREGDALAVDVRILEFINQSAGPTLDSFFLFITKLGDTLFVAATTLVIFVYLVIKHRRHAAAFLVASVAGAVIISSSLKVLFARTRPDLWETLVTEASFSFPSGHSIASSALALSLCVILWWTRWRWVAVVGGVLYALLVGFSRLYLGVHYPSDVVAGWLVSVCWVLIVAGFVSMRTITGRSHFSQRQ